MIGEWRGKKRYDITLVEIHSTYIYIYEDRIVLICVYSSPSLDDQPRQSVDHSSLIVTVDPVSHREPRIVWSITSLSWSTRLSLCHDPAGHPRRDANMGVKFAIGHRYTGFWSVRYEFGNELRDEIGGTRGKTAREVVELVRGEFWSFSFIQEFGISKGGYWEEEFKGKFKQTSFVWEIF